MMMVCWTRALAAALAVAGLSACGSSDGGDNGLFTGTPAGATGLGGAIGLGGTIGTGTGSSTPKVPFAGTGQGRSEGITIPDANNISVSNQTPAGGVTATVTLGNGSVSYQDASVIIPDIIDAVPTGSGSYVSGDSVIDVITSSRGGTLEHMAFGYVTNQTGSTINVAGFHGGDIEGLPVTPTANYRGTFIGQYYEIGSNKPADYVGSIMSLQANFATGKVTSNIPAHRQAGGRGGTSSLSSYDLLVDADITGSKFDGTVSYVDRSTSNPVGTVDSSSVNGAFYGPLGEEVGGALRVEGTPEGTPSVIVGGFGAVQF